MSEKITYQRVTETLLEAKTLLGDLLREFSLTQMALAKTEPWKKALQPFREIASYECIHCGQIVSYNKFMNTNKAEKHSLDCIWRKSWEAVADILLKDEKE